MGNLHWVLGVKVDSVQEISSCGCMSAGMRYEADLVIREEGVPEVLWMHLEAPIVGLSDSGDRASFYLGTDPREKTYRITIDCTRT
jgi:hypothetical protein